MPIKWYKIRLISLKRRKKAGVWQLMFFFHVKKKIGAFLCNIRRRLRISLDGDKYMILLALYESYSTLYTTRPLTDVVAFEGVLSNNKSPDSVCACVFTVRSDFWRLGVGIIYVLSRNIMTCTRTIIYFILHTMRMICGVLCVLIG